MKKQQILKKDYWAVFDKEGNYIWGTLAKTKKESINSDTIHWRDKEWDGAGGIGNYQFIREMGFKVCKARVIGMLDCKNRKNVY